LQPYSGRDLPLLETVDEAGNELNEHEAVRMPGAGDAH